jgi:hypothetical protein
VGIFYSYLWALAGYAKWLLTGGPFLVDTLIKKYRPDWAEKLDRWVSPSTRRKFELRLFFLAIFFAGFFAWKEEHEQVVILTKEKYERQSQIDEREVQRKHRDELIDKLSAFVKEGNELSETIAQNVADKDTIISRYRDWELRCVTMLKRDLDNSRAIQFESAKGNGLAPLTPSYGGWYSLLQGKLAVLNSFITELRSK